MISDLIIKEKLETKIIGKNTIIFDEINSTQLKAKELAEKSIDNGTLIITDSQTEGIGTHGRSWYSEKSKNIAFTLIIYPKCDANSLTGFTIDIANCMVNAIYDICNIKTSIKEPNDIMLNDKKIGGILTQIISNGEKIKYLLIGIGIDVNGVNFPEELDKIATSLRKECGKEYSREDIISRFCNIFEKYCIENKII